MNKRNRLFVLGQEVGEDRHSPVFRCETREERSRDRVSKVKLQLASRPGSQGGGPPRVVSPGTEGVLGRASPHRRSPPAVPAPPLTSRSGVHAVEVTLFTLPSWCRGQWMEQKCTTLGNLQTPSRLPRTHLRKKHDIYIHTRQMESHPKWHQVRFTFHYLK